MFREVIEFVRRAIANQRWKRKQQQLEAARPAALLEARSLLEQATLALTGAPPEPLERSHFDSIRGHIAACMDLLAPYKYVSANEEVDSLLMVCNCRCIEVAWECSPSEPTPNDIYGISAQTGTKVQSTVLHGQFRISWDDEYRRRHPRLSWADREGCAVLASYFAKEALTCLHKAANHEDQGHGFYRGAADEFACAVACGRRALALRHTQGSEQPLTLCGPSFLRLSHDLLCSWEAEAEKCAQKDKERRVAEDDPKTTLGAHRAVSMAWREYFGCFSMTSGISLPDVNIESLARIGQRCAQIQAEHPEVKGAAILRAQICLDIREESEYEPRLADMRSYVGSPGADADALAVCARLQFRIEERRNPRLAYSQYVEFMERALLVDPQLDWKDGLVRISAKYGMPDGKGGTAADYLRRDIDAMRSKLKSL